MVKKPFDAKISCLSILGKFTWYYHRSFVLIFHVLYWYFIFCTVIWISFDITKKKPFDAKISCLSILDQANCRTWAMPALVLNLVLHWDWCFLHANTSSPLLWRDTTPTTLPRQSLLGYNAIDKGTMAKSLDLQLKASLDSAMHISTAGFVAYYLDK